MSLGFTNGAYNRASGTRNAFGALSDALQRDGYPRMVSRSGDREYADQLKIWNDRMVLAGDVNGRRVYAKKKWQGKTWYQIHPDSVATPTNPPTSNHGKRRANDLTYPYNDASTAAHKRARALAPRFNITCEGLGFSRTEDWHWTFWGALGQIDQAGTPAGSAGNAKPINIDPVVAPEEEEEGEMKPRQIHYVQPNGKIVRAEIVPGTSYFVPWGEGTASAIANRLSTSHETGASVELPQAVWENFRDAAAAMLPKDRVLVQVANVDELS